MGHLLLFDISGGELMLILIVVLMFFGSKGIPGIARTLGRTMRQIRDASAEVQREIQRGAQDVKQEVDQQRRTFQPEPPPARPALRSTGVNGPMEQPAPPADPPVKAE